MNLFDFLTRLKTNLNHSWHQYLLDTLLATTSVLAFTYTISTFHLYPRIPNISIIYLLLVLPLAATRSRYASILASLIAFLSFDFFIVPPLFTFVIYNVQEWIALFIFLATAIFTGQLAATLRRSAEIATRHEQETAILYKLVRVTNNEDQLEHQLHILAQTIVTVFSPWGISDCAIIRPLHIDIPDDLTIVELDYVQIDQVLTNVLENALRYSPPDSPLDLSVHFAASEVFIRIADRGSGIPLEDLEHIFDKFYRVMGKQSLPEYPPGSGLGLAICKGVVEAHQGRIWAEQRPDGGSLFSIVLPLGKPEGIML